MDDFPAWTIKARKLEFLPFILLRTKELLWKLTPRDTFLRNGANKPFSDKSCLLLRKGNSTGCP